MLLDWFNAREASEIGTTLADQFARQSTPATQVATKASQSGETDALQNLLLRADAEVRNLRLNFYKKAKFANSFRWRLIESGVQKDVAEKVTACLVMHVSRPHVSDEVPPPHGGSDPSRVQQLLTHAADCMAKEEYAEAAALYAEIDELRPRQAEVLNNLGVALFSLGRYGEAEQRYREAIDVDPESAAALCNLADVLQADPQQAEQWVRRALRANPKYPGARTKLGLLLLSQGRDHEADVAFRKALKLSPADTAALVGMAQVARSAGRFQEAESLARRALKIDPKKATAWAVLQSLRKMTAADGEWLVRAEELAQSNLSLWDESELRFAMGKFCDDVGDFDRAFSNYRRGNELLKSVAAKYDRKAHALFADDMARTYSREALSKIVSGGSQSSKPIFVLGMPRTGTSLVEQIIASHPAAAGAGEPDFWLQAARAHHGDMRQRILDDTTRTRLATEYLNFLERRFSGALRVVDKTPANSDYVGFIHSALPNARIISMRRDPIDTCLSCYFQRFSTAMSFTMDLDDLAYYYRTHRRLMNHWSGALPAGTLLEVPYEELVADQETWTRKILDFLGLEWDKRCLSFHETKRSVNTASAWQVRQKIYRGSVERWRNYERFIGPLKDLRD